MIQVVGVDPGSRRCGFAAFTVGSEGLILRDLGVWKLSSEASLGERLVDLHKECRLFFKAHNPTLIGLEKAVAFKNVSSALVLSEARACVRLAAYQSLSECDERLVELSPTAVKKHSVGSGAASKEIVFRSLELRFAGLKDFVLERRLSFDALDALAIAWAAWVLKKRDHSQPLQPRLREGSVS